MKEKDENKYLLLSLGANVNPEAHLQEALSRLKLLFPNLETTHTMWSQAVGKPAPPYLNCLARATTGLSYEELDRRFKAIETSMGRVHNDPEGLVAIDIDILQIGLYRYHFSDWQRVYVRDLLDAPFKPIQC